MQALTDREALRHIAANVRRLRGDRSLNWLATEANTYPINVARVEKAENMPGAGLLSRLADSLEVSVETLLAPPDKNSAEGG